MESHLVRMCLDSASQSRHAVDKWRRQRRSLERLPSHLADALLRRLLSRRLLFPSLLEVFKESVEEIDLSDQSSVDAEWLAYIGAFRNLRSLNVSDCHKITSSALWDIAGMSSLKELNLSRCLKVNDSGIKHVVSISTLEKLFISETSVSANGIKLLSSLKSLTVLDLGGLLVTDLALSSLQVLTKLEHLDLWGSKISDRGIYVFQLLPQLSFLNIAWTSVGKLPNLPSLKCLNMSNCMVNSVLELDGHKTLLSKFIVSGASFVDHSEAFLHIDTNFLTYLDLSNSSLHSFRFLSHLKAVEHLDLSSTVVNDEDVNELAIAAPNLRYLNLSKTKITSTGVRVLATNVPRLETLSLSGTLVDDSAIIFISSIPSLKELDLSKTNIKGFIHDFDHGPDPIPSLQALTSLRDLRKLNLGQTEVMDSALEWVSSSHELTHVSLRNASLTDTSLLYLSHLPKLTGLSINDAVLTNQGLGLFRPPKSLKTMDLRGCWLLTADSILSFCKIHSKVEVRHELIHAIPSDQICSDRSSSSRSPLKTSASTQGNTKISFSPRFIDQRLKYTRDELLGLQYLTHPVALSRVGDNNTTAKTL